MTFIAQEVGLRILADEQGELDARQLGKQAVQPQFSAFAPWRQIAARSPPRVAVTHRQDRDARLVIESLGIDAHPIAQALAAPVVPRYAADMHLCAGRLSDDENSRRRTGLHDRARPERKTRVARAARAHGSEQALQRPAKS